MYKRWRWEGRIFIIFAQGHLLCINVVGHLNVTMSIFEPYEIEIKTGRTKDEVIDRLKRRAYIYGDKFFIDSEPYGLISRSNVVGEIRNADGWTIVSFKILCVDILKSVFLLVARCRISSNNFHNKSINQLEIRLGDSLDNSVLGYWIHSYTNHI